MDPISSLSFYQDAMADSQQLSSQLSTLQAQAATGQEYPQLSDNPTASLEILADGDQQQIIGAHLNDIQTATTALNTSVSALQQADSLLSQAQSLALQASNGTANSSSLTALGQQVNSLISSMLSVANTQNGSTYVFAGAGSSTQPPFTVSGQNAQGDPTSVSYQGAVGGASTIVGNNQQVEMYYPGSQAFLGQGPGGTDVFQTLINLRDTLLNTGGLSTSAQNQALSGDITALQNAQTQVENVLGQQSASLQSLSTMQTQLQNLQSSLQQASGNLGNADITNIVVQLQSYEQQLQLSFEAFSQISSTSLLNYLH